MSVFGCTQFQMRHFYGGSPSSSVCGNQCVFQIGQKPLLWLHFQCAAECVVEHGGKLSLIIESAAFSVKCVLLHRGVGLADFLSIVLPVFGKQIRSPTLVLQSDCQL